MYGGMGGMYGGGMGGLGGMGGMGSMYGGGMGGLGGMGMGSSMYGGGMGGLGSGMGMGSSMYGGGMGGLGSGMGMGSSMLGGNTLGSGTLAGGLNGGADAMGQQVGGMPGQSLLPGAAAEPSSPINTVAAPPPPLNETPEERGHRIRAERRKERQLVKQQREQRRQIRLQAKMEIAGHFTNVLVQTLRSSMELFAVCFGTYYSVKTVRAFAREDSVRHVRNGYQRGPGGQMVPAPAAQQAQATNAAAKPAAPSGFGKWKTWLLVGALFILGEVLYNSITRQRKPERRLRHRTGEPIEDEYGNILSHDEYDSKSEVENSDSIFSEDEAYEPTYSAHPMGTMDGGGSPSRRAYVAMYDYDAPQADGSYLKFKAGDEFIITEYSEGDWCEAVAIADTDHKPLGPRGLVPGNFMRPLERVTKL